MFKILVALATAALAVGAAAALPAPVSADLSPAEPGALAHAREIRAEVDARYRRPHGPKLAVTEASTTGVIDSFTLFGNALEEPRVVPADNGIYYAICPVGATCPYPGRSARPATAFLPRREGARACAPHVPRDIGDRRRRVAANTTMGPAHPRA